MAIYSGFSHYTWWFSTVMLVYQRVTPFNQPRTFCISTVPFRRWWLAISLTHARAMWHTTIAAGSTSPQAASGNLGLGSLGSLADVQFHVPSPLRITRALWPDFYTKINRPNIDQLKKSSKILPNQAGESETTSHNNVWSCPAYLPSSHLPHRRLSSGLAMGTPGVACHCMTAVRKTFTKPRGFTSKYGGLLPILP